MANIGKAIGDFLGFDPTPGFNLGYTRSGNNIMPAIVGQGVNPRAPQQKKVVSSPQQKGANAAEQNPNNQSSVYSGGSSGGTGGSTIDQNVLGQYQTAIDTTQGALGRLPKQLGIAQGNINNQFKTNQNELNTAKNNAKSSYDTSNTQNQQNYRTDKNQIADSASSGLRGLLRTLGAYGAGGSSDALYVAPQAVATQASAERSGAGQNYAQNAQTLDTNWNNFLNEDTNSRKKLDDWRTQQLNGVESQSETTKQSLLSKLADLMGQKAAYEGGSYQGAAQPFVDQANALSGSIDDLARINPSYNGVTPTYEAPTLGSYEVNPNTQVTASNALEQSSTPFLSLLLGNNQKKPNQAF